MNIHIRCIAVIATALSSMLIAALPGMACATDLPTPMLRESGSGPRTSPNIKSIRASSCSSAKARCFQNTYRGIATGTPPILPLVIWVTFP